MTDDDIITMCGTEMAVDLGCLVTGKMPVELGSDFIIGVAGNDTSSWLGWVDDNDTITDCNVVEAFFGLSSYLDATTLVTHNTVNGTDLTSTILSHNGIAANELSFDNTAVACFCRDPSIETEADPVPVGDTRAGDEVQTLAHGLQPVRWVGVHAHDSAEMTAHANLFPVRTSTGALGRGLPARDLCVPRRHRVLVQSKFAERMLPRDEILVARALLERLLTGPEAPASAARTDIEALFPGTLDNRAPRSRPGPFRPDYEPDSWQNATARKAGPFAAGRRRRTGGLDRHRAGKRRDRPCPQFCIQPTTQRHHSQCQSSSLNTEESPFVCKF